MNAPHKPMAEELRDIYRNAKTNMMFFKEHLEKLRKTNKLLDWLMKLFNKKYDIPVAKITIEDLIVGPDRWLGPNQIALRELIIDHTLNGGLMPGHANFSESADEAKSSDEAAKMILSALQTIGRGATKGTDINLKEIFALPEAKTI